MTRCRVALVLAILLGLALSARPQAQTRIPEASVSDRLRLENFAATPEGRELLAYLVSCALPQSAELHATARGEQFTFQGGAGLAPDWMRRGLTLKEQRWVSACILARTNFFGKPVQISMRAGPEAPEALQATDEEAQEFTLEEGAFFGNIFLEEPLAYACTGQRGPQETDDAALTDRICATPTTKRTAKGEVLTACGFIHLGDCATAERFAAEELGFDEIIHVYLQPKGPSAPENP